MVMNMQGYDLYLKLLECKNEKGQIYCKSILGAIFHAITSNNYKREEKHRLIELLSRLITRNKAYPFLPICFSFDGRTLDGICFYDYDTLICFSEEYGVNEYDAPLTAVMIFKQDIHKLLKIHKEVGRILSSEVLSNTMKVG